MISCAQFFSWACCLGSTSILPLQRAELLSSWIQGWKVALPDTWEKIFNVCVCLCLCMYVCVSPLVDVNLRSEGIDFTLKLINFTLKKSFLMLIGDLQTRASFSAQSVHHWRFWTALCSSFAHMRFLQTRASFLYHFLRIAEWSFLFCS